MSNKIMRDQISLDQLDRVVKEIVQAPKSDLDNLVCITVPINFAQYGSIDKALADLCAQRFRPDFIVIDTAAGCTIRRSAIACRAWAAYREPSAPRVARYARPACR